MTRVEQNCVYTQQRTYTINVKSHFRLFKMELYLSGADSYLIQIFKWTLESWELIAANSLFHAIFTTLAMYSPK
mgnify:FL=1